MEERACLIGIEHDRRITGETDSRFLFSYQRAVLLSLRDGGALDETQYRYAEETLKNQFQAYIGKQNDTQGGGEEP